MNPAIPSTTGAPVCVVSVGPPPGAIGGIASVDAEMRTLAFGGRYRLVPFASTSTSGEGERLTSRIRRHLGQFHGLARVIRRTSARIVHIHTCSGFSFLRSAIDLELARLMGCKTVLHVHGGTFDQFFDNGSGAVRTFVRRSLGRAHRVIALSALWRRRLTAMSPSARIAVVENAVPIPSFVAEPPVNSPCRFVLLARMDDWKGVNDLLAAAGLLRDRGVAFDLTLAGPPGSAGDERTIPARIAGHGLAQCVRYVGPVVGPAKTQLLRAADVLVQPSHAEGLPMSLLEAMAHGLAVVATMVGAMPEVIDHGVNGLLVAPREPAALAECMAALVAHPRTRASLGARARETVQNRYALERFEFQLQEIYDVLTAAENAPDREVELRGNIKRAALTLR